MQECIGHVRGKENTTRPSRHRDGTTQSEDAVLSQSNSCPYVDEIYLAEDIKLDSIPTLRDFVGLYGYKRAASIGLQLPSGNGLMYSPNTIHRRMKKSEEASGLNRDHQVIDRNAILSLKDCVSYL